MEDEELKNKIEEWLKYDFNELTRQTVLRLIKANDVKALKGMMLNPLVFGTAGLRAKMNAGFSFINDVTIIQTNQGLLKYLEECAETKDKLKEKGIVIGFDGRYNSHRWAKMSANIFINAGVKVYLFSHLCPTPFVPFALKYYSCVAGVMVTASHNPREYNGYKLYWTNGVQLTSPHDKHIADNIDKYKEPWKSSWIDFSEHQNSPLQQDPLMEITNSYMKFVTDRLLYKNLNVSANIKIAFTPLHGVGWVYIKKAFEAGGFSSVYPVIKQQDPDANFPTLDFPNPEEGKFVMKLAMETALNNQCSLVLATDPDADRMAAVEKQSEDNWHYFTGNEQGTLLGWWAYHCWLNLYNSKIPHNEHHEPQTNNTQKICDQDVILTDDLKNRIKKLYMVASTVSGHLLQKMAEIEGFGFEETLTGFKWIGNKADELIESGHEVIFAYEEAIGYMCDSRILDKDGISASLLLAEMASYLKIQKNMTLYQKLMEIYEKYGYNEFKNSYLSCYDPKIIASIFDSIRNWQGHQNTYPKTCGPYVIKYIRDLTTGYDNSKPDNKAVLPFSKSNQMITFTFEHLDIKLTLRASGTEPKIKYYSEILAPVGYKDKDKIKDELKSIVGKVVEEFLKPGVNNISYPDMLPE
ncbi:unnamed protein product [Gordionus sp. m RMFG-2023]|uniref:phosphopentomutase-like n=1 Tax=Gordionus sp. m RMFG-2023 TaxID=3053472 RepID=UPI0030E45A9B